MSRPAPAPPWANPFRSARIEALPFRFAGGGWAELHDRFAACGRRGAVVGPHGSGKTTLLEQFAARLAAAGMDVRRCRLPGRGTLGAALRRAWSVPADTVLVLDGGEHLSRSGWRTLLALAPRRLGLLATAHVPTPLPTLLATATSPALLAGLVQALQGTALPMAEAEALHAAHRGNLRECLRALYDRVAMASPSCAGAPALPLAECGSRNPS